MKITYDKEADAMRIIWNEDAKWKANKIISEGYEFLLMVDVGGESDWIRNSLYLTSCNQP